MAVLQSETFCGGLYSAVAIAVDHRLNIREIGVPFSVWMICHPFVSSRQFLGFTQPPFQLSSGKLPLKLNRPERISAHLPSTNSEIKNAWIKTSIQTYAFVARILMKHRDEFCFRPKCNRYGTGALGPYYSQSFFIPRLHYLA
jgi:hypothetical protein